MVQTLSLVGAAFAVGGSYFAVDSLRDILLAKTINTSYATRIAIAGAATLAGLAMISNAAASQSRKTTKNQLSKQLMSAEAYDHRTERAWSGMLSNAPGDAVVNQVDLFHDKHILAHDDAHRAAQSWLKKNEKAQFNEIHYMLYQIDAGKWGMEYLALDTMDAEELTFHDWSEQEMMNHGKDDSFDDWVEHEIDSHGNKSLRDWADDEEESHTKRYGAEDMDIAYACDRAEQIMGEHIKNGIVKEKDYYTLDIDGNMIETDDDPSGFTELGREVFENLYSELVEGTPESKIPRARGPFTAQDAESKRYTRRPIDRFTRKPKAKAGAYRSRGRRSAIKSMFGAEDDDDTDLVPDRDPRRGAPDLWFAETKICNEDCGWGSGRTSSKDVQCTSPDPTCGLCNFHPVDDWIVFTHECGNGHPVCNRCWSGGTTLEDGIIGDGAGNPCRHCVIRSAEDDSKKTFPPIFKKATTGKIQEWRIRTEELPDGNWAYTSSHGQLGGSMVEGKGTIIKAGKQGRTVEEQANAEAAAKWKKKKETGYFGSADEATNNVVVLPMTALNFKNRAHDINWPAIGQPKLDGVRCLARLEADGTISLTSRKNKLFPGLDHIRDELATRLKSLGNSEGSPFPHDIVIDGELYADPKELTFQQSTGVVRRNNKTPEDLEDEKKIKLNVYDCINLNDLDMDFIDRHNLMADSLSNMDSIAIVDNTTLSDTDAVDPLHDQFVMDGYEGLMIRNVKGPYKLNGKSKHLQKYKSFQDDEFEIVGYAEGKGDYVGTVIWICETSDGKRFRIKPNGTHAYRSKLFDEADSHIGKQITVRFFELTDGGLPRHPTGGWFRDYEAESFDADFEAERGCSYPCPDCGTMMYQHNSNTDFGSYCSCIKCGSNYITKPMKAESSKHWDESSRTMWDQSEVTDPDELVRLGKIFKVGNGNPEDWKQYLDKFGSFVYVTKDTRPWALWQPGSKEAVVRFNNRGKTRDNLHITDIQQLYEIKSDESFDAEAPHYHGDCDDCKQPMMLGKEIKNRSGVPTLTSSKMCQGCDEVVCGSCHSQAKVCPHCDESFGAEGAPTADEKCDLDYHLRCHDCRLCLDCNLEADAGGNVCRFCTGESIERFDAFSTSDRPVSVSFGKGTSGNAKMKAVFTDGSGDTKTTQFGYKGMSDYTKHGDDKRKSSYLARHGAKSSGQKWNDPTTAGSLSRWVLWNKKSLSESKKSFKNKFNLGAEGNYESPIEEEGYQKSIFITEAGRRSVWAYEPDYSITEDSL